MNRRLAEALRGRRATIISMLSEDGRRSLVEIARSLGISHVAVRRHLEWLRSKGIMRVQGNINPSALGLKLILVFMEVVDAKHLNEIVSRFRRCPRAILLATMMGGYNIVALLYAEDDGVLECMTTTCSIRTMEGIRRTEIYILADTIKPRYMPITLTLGGDLEETPCGRACVKCPGYSKCMGCPITRYYKLPLQQMERSPRA